MTELLKLKTVEDANFKGKKVLIRVDFNVPLNHNRQVTDVTRIRESLPTIRKVLDDGAAVILMSHLGRPKGGFEGDYSLTPVVPIVSKMLNSNIIFTRDLFGPKTIEVAAGLQPGQVMLLENLRFYPEEIEGDETFARSLASLADIYVNDAFGTSHRPHASVYTVAKFFKKEKYFGLLLANEIKNLDKILNSSMSPFTAIIGGAKVSSKIDIIRNLMNKVDNMIIGGGMAFTFIKALDGKIGDSLVEDDKIDLARNLVREMMLKGVNLYLPTDSVITDAFSNEGNIDIVSSYSIPDKWQALDIGPKSRRRFTEIINSSHKILWNGPMGVFEMGRFRQGTKAIAIAVSSATISGAFSSVGGGDSVAAINEYNLADQVSYVSTGGGAMLEYLEGKDLPAIRALLD
jgi:phosphoglycerate kinase